MSRTRLRYEPGAQLVPGYRLVQYLGGGCFGDVWMAAGPGGSEVALKFVDLSGREGPKELEGLQRIKRLHHPNLVGIAGAWSITEDGQVVDDLDSLSRSGAIKKSLTGTARFSQFFFARSKPAVLVIAMDLGSKNLSDRLKECRAQGLDGIPIEELLRYMEGAADGIDYLNQPDHGLGAGDDTIVHGDIKPYNLLIVGNAVKVCDYGLVRSAESLRRTAMGTPAYMAPELLQGTSHVASDQYCLAVTYVELRTGDLPFDATLSQWEVAQIHINGQLDLSRLSPGEAAVIRRATSPDPAQRWRSCREMVREIALASGVHASLPPVEPRSSSTPVRPTRVTPLRPGIETTPVVKDHTQRSKRPHPRRFWLVVLALLLCCGPAAYRLSPTVRQVVNGLVGIGRPPPPLKTTPETPEEFAREFQRIADEMLRVRTETDIEPIIQQRDHLEGAWHTRIADLAFEGDFRAAAAILDAAPDRMEKEKNEERNKLRRRWTDRLDAKIKSHGFGDAFRLLESEALPGVPAEELAERRNQVWSGWAACVQELIQSQGRTRPYLAVEILRQAPQEPQRREELLQRPTKKVAEVLNGMASRTEFASACDLLGILQTEWPANLWEELRAALQPACKDHLEVLARRGGLNAAVESLRKWEILWPDPAKRQKFVEKLRSAWSEHFDALLSADKVPEAEEALKGLAHDALLDARREELWARLTAAKLRLWTVGFDNLVQEKKYKDAAERLKHRPAGILENDLKDRQTGLSAAWHKDTLGRWQTAEAGKERTALLGSVEDDCRSLLECLPHCVEANEAKMLRARALVELGGKENHGQARQIVQGVATPPDHLSPLRTALNLILEDAAATLPEERLKTRREALENEQKRIKPSQPWGLSDWEQKRIASIKPSLPPPPPDSPLSGLIAQVGKLAIRGDYDGAKVALAGAKKKAAEENVQADWAETFKAWESLLATLDKVESLTAGGQYSQARDLISAAVAQVRSAAPEQQAEWSDKIRRWDAFLAALLRVQSLVASREYAKAKDAVSEVEKLAGAQKDLSVASPQRLASWRECLGLLADLMPLAAKSEYAKAKEKLAGAKKLTPAIKELRLESAIGPWERFLDALADLADPKADEKRAAEAITAAKTLVGASGADVEKSIAAGATLALCRALGGLSAKRIEAAALALQIDQAIGVLRLAHQGAIADRPAISVELARLWQTRATLYVRSGEALPREQVLFDQLEEDVSDRNLTNPAIAGPAGLDVDLLDAWRCECAMAMQPNDSAVRARAMQLRGDAPYVRYVRASALNTPIPSSPQKTIEELILVFAGQPVEILSVPARRKKAVDWAMAAADAWCKEQGLGSLAGVFAPSAASKQDQACYRLLKSVSELGGDAVEPQQPVIEAITSPAEASDPLGPDQSQKLGLNLALAALRVKDLPLSRAHTAAILKAIEANEWKEDVRPALCAYLASRLQGGTILEAPGVIDAAGRLLQRMHPEPDNHPEPAEAAILYGEILLPIRKAAQNAPSEAGAEFCRKVGDFLLGHRAAKWPGGEVLAKIADWYDTALQLYGPSPRPEVRNSVASCSMGRGRARMKQAKPDCLLVIQDAENAAKLDPELHAAHGLLGEARLIHARSRPKLAERMENLRLSIEASLKADAVAAAKEGVKSANQEEGSARAEYNSLASIAYVEYANCLREEKEQEKYLDWAVDCAKRAAHFQTERPDYPYLSLGNAYEDLAWAVEREPRQNYQLARDNFREAAKKVSTVLISAQAWCSMGRCYYRSVAATYLDPRPDSPVLGMQTREAVLGEAESCLNRATVLDPECVEAHFWLAQVNREMAAPASGQAERTRRFVAADQYLQQAKTLAGKLQLDIRVYYLSSWVQFPLRRTDLSKEERCAEVLRRAEELRDPNLPLAPGELVHPRKELALALAAVHGTKGEYAQAKEICDRELPANLDAAELWDVNLLIERARYNYRLASAGSPSATMEDVARDASKAASLATVRDTVAIASALAASARASLYEQSKDRRLVDQALEEFRTAIRFAKRRPHSAAWLKEGAKLLLGAKLADASPPPSAYEQFQIFGEAIQWLAQAIPLAVTAQERGDLTGVWKMAVDRGIAAADAVLNQAPNLDAKLLEEVREKKKEWERQRSKEAP